MIKILQVCLGFVKNINDNGVAERVTNEWVLAGNYHVDIAGKFFFFFVK